MMEFNLDRNDTIYQISAYTQGEIVVRHENISTAYQQSLMIAPTKIICPWIKSFEDLNAETLSSLLSFSSDYSALNKPEIILIGTGEKFRQISPALIALVQSQGTGIEIMDTQAACRTFNLLAAERRAVLAGLIL